jgi:hypothetical protein
MRRVEPRGQSPHMPAPVNALADRNAAATVAVSGKVRAPPTLTETPGRPSRLGQNAVGREHEKEN